MGRLLISLPERGALIARCCECARHPRLRTFKNQMSEKEHVRYEYGRLAAFVANRKVRNYRNCGLNGDAGASGSMG